MRVKQEPKIRTCATLIPRDSNGRLIIGRKSAPVIIRRRRPIPSMNQKQAIRKTFENQETMRLTLRLLREHSYLLPGLRVVMRQWVSKQRRNQRQYTKILKTCSAQLRSDILDMMHSHIRKLQDSRFVVYYPLPCSLVPSPTDRKSDLHHQRMAINCQQRGAQTLCRLKMIVYYLEI